MTCPREIPHCDVESAPALKDQEYAKEPLYRCADSRDDQRTGRRRADSEVCRRHGLSSATFYKLKAEYGGIEVSEAVRLKALEDENAKLKRLLADTMLDRAIGPRDNGNGHPEKLAGKVLTTLIKMARRGASGDAGS